MAASPQRRDYGRSHPCPNLSLRRWFPGNRHYPNNGITGVLIIYFYSNAFCGQVLAAADAIRTPAMGQSPCSASLGAKCLQSLQYLPVRASSILWTPFFPRSTAPWRRLSFPRPRSSLPTLSFCSRFPLFHLTLLRRRRYLNPPGNALSGVIRCSGPADGVSEPAVPELPNHFHRALAAH